jgi:hypothetical protein
VSNILSSHWDGLNPNLIASFWAVNRDGIRIDNITVKAPLTESSLEMTLNWQSPFEQVAQGVAPTLQQVIQSGAAIDAANLLSPSIAEYLKSTEGKTSITKLNSTQIFIGMPPAKFTVTALFRAWRDPKTEVMDPFNQLMQWALPVVLSEDGPISSMLKGGGLFPSTAPVMIAVKYKDAVYAPMVIESITKDTNAPIDRNGNFVELSVPMVLSTLAAVDRGDWSLFTVPNQESGRLLYDDAGS